MLRHCKKQRLPSKPTDHGLALDAEMQMGPGACFIPELVRYPSHQDVHGKLFLDFHIMILMILMMT